MKCLFSLGKSPIRLKYIFFVNWVEYSHYKRAHFLSVDPSYRFRNLSWKLLMSSLTYIPSLLVSLPISRLDGLSFPTFSMSTISASSFPFWWMMIFFSKTRVFLPSPSHHLINIKWSISNFSVGMHENIDEKNADNYQKPSSKSAALLLNLFSYLGLSNIWHLRVANWIVIKHEYWPWRFSVVNCLLYAWVK